MDIISSTITKSAMALSVWKGQTLDIELEVVKDEVQPDGSILEVPENLTGALVKFTVRVGPSFPEALVFKTSDDPAQIEILSPETDGLIVIHLVPEDTSGLEVSSQEPYLFDVWVGLSGGEQGPVIEVSEFIVKEPITKF